MGGEGKCLTAAARGARASDGDARRMLCEAGLAMGRTMHGQGAVFGNHTRQCGGGQRGGRDKAAPLLGEGLYLWDCFDDTEDTRAYDPAQLFEFSGFFFS